MQKGWVKANNKYYYLNTDGKMVVGQSLNIDGYKVRIIDVATWSLLKEETTLSTSKRFVLSS